MKKIYNKLSHILFSIAILAATLSVNVTCCRRYHQEELSDQLSRLRKYKDE